jgi:hypothetical protein
MKRFESKGWYTLRDKGPHETITDGIHTESIPRHSEINERLARALLLHQLNIACRAGLFSGILRCRNPLIRPVSTEPSASSDEENPRRFDAIFSWWSNNKKMEPVTFNGVLT